MLASTHKVAEHGARDPLSRILGRTLLTLFTMGRFSRILRCILYIVSNLLKATVHGTSSPTQANMLLSRVVTAVPSESTFGKAAIPGHTHTARQNRMCRKRGEAKLPRDVDVVVASEEYIESHVFISPH